MKVFVLVLFSLLISVNSEDAKPVETKKIESVYPLNKNNYYYGNQGYLGNEENRRYGEGNYNRNDGRPSQIYGNNNYGYGREERGYGKEGRPSQIYGNNNYGYGREERGYGKEGRPSQIYGNNNYGYGREERGYGKEGRPSQIYGNNNYGYGREDEYTRNNRKNVQNERENIGYYARDPEGRRFYGNKRNYQYRLIGRVGLGFDKRTANAYSYLAPITPERLELVGSRPFQLNNNGYNYQNLNLYRGSNVGKYV